MNAIEVNANGSHAIDWQLCRVECTRDSPAALGKLIHCNHCHRCRTNFGSDWCQNYDWLHQGLACLMSTNRLGLAIQLVTNHSSYVVQFDLNANCNHCCLGSDCTLLQSSCLRCHLEWLNLRDFRRRFLRCSWAIDVSFEPMWVEFQQGLISVDQGLWLLSRVALGLNLVSLKRILGSSTITYLERNPWSRWNPVMMFQLANMRSLKLDYWIERLWVWCKLRANCHLQDKVDKPMPIHSSSELN